MRFDYAYERETWYKKFDGTSWSSASVFDNGSNGGNTAPAMAIDPSTGNVWSVWIVGGSVDYAKYSSGSWSGRQFMSTWPMFVTGISVDFDLHAGVVKVMINDAGWSQPHIYVKTLN